MPPWGAKLNKLGNNPLVIAMPYEKEAIVLDMAMSQFSFGSLEQAAMKGTKLSVPGGYDENGNITSDPDAVLATRRIMPTGFWKGAGLSFVLDILATLLSDGLSVHEISKGPVEANLSQVFIVIDVGSIGHSKDMQQNLQSIMKDYHEENTSFPGERVLKTRAKNSKEGIPVLKKVWDEVESL
jgi:3-dehydro-L-gulonate 2-dehydrogenase